MSRTIIVRVVDEGGYGLYGVKVNVYGGDHCYTDASGAVTLFVETSDVSIYVNGRTAYSGATSRCDSPLIYVKK
jgi:hypothetical protein